MVLEESGSIPAFWLGEQHNDHGSPKGPWDRSDTCWGTRQFSRGLLEPSRGLRAPSLG